MFHLECFHNGIILIVNCFKSYDTKVEKIDEIDKGF